MSYQGRYPTTDSNIANASDFIQSGAQEIKDIYDPNSGKYIPTLTTNSRQLKWMGQTVTSDRLGDLATDMEILYAMGEESVYHMTHEMAESVKQMINGLYSAMFYGINAKSSETIRDKKNQHNNIIQMFTKQQSPYIKMEDEMERGIFGNLFNKKERPE